MHWEGAFRWLPIVVACAIIMWRSIASIAGAAKSQVSGRPALKSNPSVNHKLRDQLRSLNASFNVFFASLSVMIRQLLWGVGACEAKVPATATVSEPAFVKPQKPHQQPPLARWPESKTGTVPDITHDTMTAEDALANSAPENSHQQPPLAKWPQSKHDIDTNVAQGTLATEDAPASSIPDTPAAGDIAASSTLATEPSLLPGVVSSIGPAVSASTSIAIDPVSPEGPASTPQTLVGASDPKVQAESKAPLGSADVGAALSVSTGLACWAMGAATAM
jgi:hypothetical protein